jgi:hypothetical protein
LTEFTIENGKQYKPTESELNRQKRLSSFSDSSVNTDAFNFAFPENRRILAFNGISTASFFTTQLALAICGRNVTGILCLFSRFLMGAMTVLSLS